MVRVLVVENDAVVAGALRILLRRAGFEPTFVAGAEEAMSSLHLVGADVVVIDTGVPDLDSTEVCRRIREQSAVPVVVVSSEDPVDAEARARAAGADAFLAVPHTGRALVTALRAVLPVRREALPADEGASRPSQ
ncbi:hypothetical protein GCM10027047_12200 [Rhodococcus aerolatus]